MSHMAPDHRGRIAFRMYLNGYDLEQIRRALRYETLALVCEAIDVNMPEVYRARQP